MQHLLIDPDEWDGEAATEAAEVIRSGGVVLYPADTVYGLGCDPFQEPALDRLLQIKGRSGRKGMLVLVAEVAWIKRLALEPPADFNDLARRFWPGSVTVLLPARPALSPKLTGEGRKVGVRLPEGRFLKTWLEAVSGPIVSTSANLSGKPPLQSRGELMEAFAGGVDLFLEAKRPPSGLPSTVVDFCMDPPCIVRRGRLASQIQEWIDRL